MRQMLRAFVSSDDPASRAEAVRVLRANLLDPSDLIRCDTIPDAHALKSEAYAARDAFESVANGMADPDAAARLGSLGPGSAFRDWRTLVEAISALYSGSPAEALALARSIGEDSPLRSLVASFEGFLGAGAGEAFSDPLATAIFKPDEELSASLAEAEEAACEGFEDLFAAAAARALRAAAKLSREAASAFALWCLDAGEAAGFAGASSARAISGILGADESARLRALRAGGAGALAAWLESFVARLELAPMSEAETAARAAISAAAFAGGGRPTGPDEALVCRLCARLAVLLSSSELRDASVLLAPDEAADGWFGSEAFFRALSRWALEPYAGMARAKGAKAVRAREPLPDGGGESLGRERGAKGASQLELFAEKAAER
jgi:hypothetical protein